MSQTRDSRRAVFRRIARQSYTQWPVYDSTPLYERSSLDGLESDIRIVSQTWFRHDRHESIENFVCALPLAYFEFGTHDRYGGSTHYEMDTLFRVFLLKELHGWAHETALIEYLECRPALCDQLDLETVPDQSTLWRSWHKRFTDELRETVQNAARTILIKAQNADVAVPLVLDACPVRKGESRKDIVEDLLDSAEPLVHVDNVLMDREFDSHTFWR